jgi:hypothetical protein
MPGLITLQCDSAAYGHGLLGHVDHAHAVFADLLHQLVGPDDRPGALGDWARGQISGRVQVQSGTLEVISELLLIMQQRLNLGAEVVIGTTTAIEIGQAIPLRSDLERVQEYALG